MAHGAKRTARSGRREADGVQRRSAVANTQPGASEAGRGPTRKELARAAKDVERSKARQRMGRRALLLGGGAVLCVGAAAGVVELEQKLGGDFAAGLEQGAKNLAHDLQNLGSGAEQLALTAAVDIADLTEWGTEHLIAPIADLTETLGDDVLGVLYAAVSGARDALGHADVHFAALDGLAGALGQARAFLDNKQRNPHDYTIGHFLTTEVKLADDYLHQLQTRLDQV